MDVQMCKCCLIDKTHITRQSMNKHGRHYLFTGAGDETNKSKKTFDEK